MRLFKLFTLVAFGFATLAFTPEPITEDKALDLELSTIGWKAYKVTGSHEGTLKLKSGTLSFEESVLVGGSFVVDMTTITCTDLKAGQGKEKLEGHLMSPDFFGVEQYPEATFTIDSVSSRGAEGDYRVAGTITIKDKTQPLKFNAIVSADGDQSTATASFKLDRTDFDVRYGSGSFFDNLGDKTIYDEFDLTINLVM